MELLSGFAVLLGGPGSGKGTQCLKIAETFGFKHIGAGDLLRKEMYSGSENGAMIQKLMTEGGIAPSEVTVKLIKKAIESAESCKFLIDGFPRSEENRMVYERIIGAEPNFVLFFDCPEEVMVKRVLSRNEGRVDDNEHTVKERLKVYKAITLPVVNHYAKKGKLYKVDGTGTQEEIFERVQPVFTSLRESQKGPMLSADPYTPSHYPAYDLLHLILSECSIPELEFDYIRIHAM
ncbi:hypothetical protein RND71_030065 [Anisodus tanguticus]|uniref:adenylate kinase n=1 Tax=Anisodus tanguticus TaxID=243964 RepID=A0AAE1V0R2_9SOLA|nr:hypothetical protein RND71_030065 [Anisodus tanguticus]